MNRLLSRVVRRIRRTLWAGTARYRARRHGVTLGPENFCCVHRGGVDVVVDVGVGRIPTFAPWMQSLTGAYVVLCDPTPKHLAVLRRWVASNDAAFLVEAALAGADGESHFFESESEESGSLDGTHINLCTKGSFLPVRLVSLRRLLDLARSRGAVGLVKVDVEGAEFDIFGACVQLEPQLILSVPQWLVEFHPVPQTSHSFWEVVSIRRAFRRLGFLSFSPNGTDYLFWLPEGGA